MKRVWHRTEEDSWIPHPIAQDVTIKTLISKKNDDAGVTCMLVVIPRRAQVPEHVHEEQDDILYPLKGKAIIWIDGWGSFSLEPGIIVRVPKGIKT